MHLSGSAPQNQVEASKHIRITIEEGYNAEINFCINSDEWDTLCGDTCIPAFNFRGVTLIISI